MKKTLVLLTTLLILVGCGTKPTDDNVIKVASHKAPMTDIVDIAKEELKKEGYELELVSVSDNVMANTMLNAKEIDANFFQHVPFMNQFNDANNGTLVGIQPIYDAIVGFYSKTTASLSELPNNAKIAIPNDAVNQARALLILEDAGLITLANGVGNNATLKDIVDHKNYEFLEVDLLMLASAYDEVDLVFNYPSYVAHLGLKPLNNALIVENSTRYYAISLVAREDNKDSKKINALKKAMTSDAVKTYIEENHKDTIIPTF